MLRPRVFVCAIYVFLNHFSFLIAVLQLFLEVHGEDTKAFCAGAKDQIDCMTDDKNRIFIMELVLHCSDISNPFKPYKLCAKWADLVVEVSNGLLVVIVVDVVKSIEMFVVWFDCCALPKLKWRSSDKWCGYRTACA